MRYFGKFYLDKEKDIEVTLWMDRSVLSYTIHAIDHRSDNLINNLAAISGQETELRDGRRVITGRIPCYIKGDGQRVYIFRLSGTKLANIYPDGKIEVNSVIPAIAKTLMSQTTEAQFDQAFAVNVKGIYNCVNAAMPFFLNKQAGCVITVSSMWGQVGASCEAAYSATKGAVIALTKALAKELGPSGIRVNCVAPGVILTDMCADIDPEILEELRQESPIGRHGTPDDVAASIEYLANAPFVTGQVLGVNGGFVI